MSEPSAVLFDGLKVALDAPDLREDSFSVLVDRFRDDRAVGFLASVHDACVQGRELVVAPDCVLQAVVANLRARLAPLSKLHLAKNPHFKGSALNDFDSDDVVENDDLFSQRLIETVFTTSTEASRRLLVATALSVAPAAAQIQIASDDATDRSAPPTNSTPLHIASLRLDGTGADWMLLESTVEAFVNGIITLLRDGPRSCAGDLARAFKELQHAETDFCEAMALVRLLRATQDDQVRRQILDSAYHYTPGAGASGWLPHLALVSDGACPRASQNALVIVPLRTERAVDGEEFNHYYVGAQQDTHESSYAVIRVTQQSLIEKLRALMSENSRSKEYGTLDAVVAAVERRDRDAAVTALSQLRDQELASGNLQRCIENRDWGVARLLIERLQPLKSKPVVEFAGSTFLPADSDDEDAGDADERKTQPSLHADDVKFVAVEPHRETECAISGLSRAALLRLQRWALDEMIADPELDLTALTRVNTREAARFCVKLQIASYCSDPFEARQGR